MAEEAEVVEAQGGPTEAGNDLSSKLAAIGSFLDQKQISELETEFKANLEAIKPEGEQTPAAAAENKEEPNPGDKKDDKQEDPKKNPPAAEEKKTALGLAGKKNKTTPTEVVIEKPEQFLDVIKKDFGMEIKDLKETNKFFEATRGWREKAVKFDDLNKKHTAIENEIANLPSEFGEAFQLLAEGKDYTKPFTESKPKFDFKLPAEKQDVKALVTHYFPKGNFTDADFAEEEKTPNLLTAIELAQEKYNLEKQGHERRSAEVAQSAQKQQAAYKESVDSSFKTLQTSFPDIEEDAVKEIRSLFEGGREKVLSIFFNENGTVKPEALERAVMAMYGKSEIEAMMDRAAHIAETKTHEDILTRGADTSKPVKNSGSQETISEETKKKLEELNRIAGKNKNTF